MVDSISESIQTNPLQYNGKITKIYKIWIHNFLLNFLTLGVYSFWGKTKLRKYLVSHIQMGEDQFEYTGRGIELFKGFLKALGVFIIYFVGMVGIEFIELPYTETTLGRIFFFAINVLSYMLVYMLIIIATYSSLRYKISRIRWRGIRMMLAGSSMVYLGLILRRTLTDILTLGLKTPMTVHLITTFFVKNFYFGNIQFTFEGDPKELKKINIITLLLLIPSLGLSRMWFHAALLRYRTNHLSLGNIKFLTKVRGHHIFMRSIINTLLALFTLGLALPYINHRNMCFFSKHLYLIGDLNSIQAHQRNQDNISSGEGLSTMLDVEMAFI